jgi:hypothetical protein
MSFIDILQGAFLFRSYKTELFVLYKYVSGYYPSSCFYLKHNVSEAGFCLFQVKPTQLGPINRAIPYLGLPALTQDIVYKPSIAQTIYES